MIEDNKNVSCELIGRYRRSDYLTEIVEPADSKVDRIETVYTAHNYERPGWTYSPKPCIFSGFERDLASKFIERLKCKTLRDWVYDDLTEYPEPFRSNLHSLLVNAWVFEREIEKPVINADDIIRLSLMRGPTFAKELDQYRAATLGSLHNIGFLSPEISEIYKTFRQSNVEIRSFRLDSMYRPNMLFNWDAPELNLEDVSFEPVEMEQKYLDLFRESVAEVLKNPKMDFAEEIAWQEIESDNSKSCVEGKNYQQQRCEPAQTRGVSRLVQVPRELKEKRLACVEEYSSALRIRWIEANVQRILSADKRSKMKHKPQTIKFELDKAMKPYKKQWQRGTGGKGVITEDTPYSYCRDFKKEGLTKPRIIVRIILEELNKRFPRFKSFETTGFFDEWKPVDSSGRVYNTLRGHGLGMASAITTLMQISIENLNTKLSGIRPKWSGYVNDDAVVVDNNRDNLIDYIKTDQIVCKALGLKFKTKASFICQGYAVLCEQYSSEKCRDINRKDVYYLQEFNNLLKSVNVTHAKFSSNSMNLANIPNNYIENVMNYWGWVLFRNEQAHSIYEGGWWRNVSKGIDLSFYLRNSEEKISIQQISAIKTYDCVEKQVFPWIKGAKLINYKPKSFDDYSEDYREVKGIKLLNKQNMFRPSMNGDEETRSWRAYQRSLRAVFRKKMSENRDLGMTVLEVYESAIKKHPERDILPPDSECKYVKCNAKVIYNDFIFHHPYQGYGNKKDYEIYSRSGGRNYYNIKSANTGEIRFEFPKFDSQTRSTDSAANYLKFTRTKGNIPGWRPAYYHAVLEPNAEVMKFWHNPFACIVETDRWRRGHYTGVLPVRGQSDLIKTRSKVYGRELTAEEWYEVGTISPFDQIILIMCMDENWCTEDIKEFCSELRRYPGLGHLINFVNDPNHLYCIRLMKKWIRCCEARKEYLERENPDPEYDNSWFLDENLGRVISMPENIDADDMISYIVQIDEFGNEVVLEGDIEVDKPTCLVDLDNFNVQEDDWNLGFTEEPEDIQIDYGDLEVTMI